MTHTERTHPPASLVAASASGAIADWLRAQLQALAPGASIAAQAREMHARTGVSIATIYRMLKPTPGAQTSSNSIYRIAAALDVPPPAMLPPLAPADPPTPRGMAEDVAEYRGPEGFPPIDAQSKYLSTVTTRALDLEGLLPGDMIRVDMAAQPRAGDIVVAQFERGLGAETKLRLYDPPYLLTMSSDPAQRDKPRAVDDAAYRIAGVVDLVVRKFSR